MSSERRRLRSGRALGAVALLAGASLVVTSAALLATFPVLVGAAALAVVAGVVAARLLSNEIAHTRREWSKDRAQQAKAYQRILSDRTREQATFAQQMTERLTRRDADLLEVRGNLRISEARAHETGQRLEAERRRSAELSETVEGLKADQDQVAEALAVWDGADVPTIVDLLNWEQAATAASTRAHDDESRKQA
ncbi:hypothetical protein [Solicola sp. PLA-1-18]|uniref:hypothetical protein n=1 Tax=Solicola sp. PLA-1-18 TaxID=3380532 RepID=UPI003B7FAF58